MYPYIICYTCGKALGDICDAFKALRAAKYQEAYNDPNLADIDPMMLAITGDLTINLEDVFEMLCVDLQCCRTKLTTQVEFKELC